MSKTLTVEEYTIEINGAELDCDADDFDLFFDDGSHKTLYVEPEHDGSFELMSCREKQSGALFMDHLFVPKNYRNKNLGKLGVAFFYYLLDSRGYRKFCIKFGGGDKSASFLGRLGFDHSVIHSKKDVDYAGQSVMVGDLTETGSRSYDWSLRPISTSNFATGFFTLR